MDINSRVRLNNGVEMPYLGLGTWLMSRREAHTCVGWALEAGYRHIDTAKLYANEREVGAAVRESGIPREDIFVTTKLIDEDQGYRRTFQGFNESLSKMGLDYIDLYLIHFPVARLRGDSWRAMVEILQTGAVRAIGVSNYVEQHLDELLARSTVVPAVNQVMCNPYVYPVQVQDYCRARGIVLEGYSPLTHAWRINDPRLARIGKQYGKTAAQVLIRWAMQKGIPVIPKSVHRERISENADVFDFELAPGHVAEMDSLNEGILYV
jgi:diketogulonate reductase-like aldo/keto reductase